MPGRVGLIGYFGWGNFGDELFFRQWQESLGVERTFRVNDLLHRPYTSRPAAAVAEGTQAFVIGGGDLIRTESISALYWNRAWTRRPLVISGIGVAQESGRQRSDVVPRLREFVAAAPILSLSARDPQSQRWIEEELRPTAPVTLVPDLAFAAVAMPKESSGISSGRLIVGVVLNKRVTPLDVDLLRSLFDAEKRGAISVRLLVLASGSQREQEEEQLSAYGLLHRAETFGDVSEMISAVSSVSLLFSAKFHGLVVASGLGIPSRSLRSTSKALGLANTFGMPHMVLGASPASLPTPSELESDVSLLRRIVPQLRVQAKAEIRRVRELLEDNLASGGGGRAGTTLRSGFSH